MDNISPFIKKSLKLQKEIINYLVKSRINNFHKLFSQVNLLAEIFKDISNKSNTENDIILRLLVNEMIDNANDSNINQLKPIIIHFLFFRSKNIINDALKELYNKSPFCEQPIIETNIQHSKTNNLKNIKHFENFVNSYNSVQLKSFHFGLHISKEGEWLDSEIAQKITQKVKIK